MAELSGCLVNGRYSVDKKIQSGYYGTTWVAMDKQQSKDVCLKTFFRENASQEKELAILKKLSQGRFSHDNICAVLDVCTEKAPVLAWSGEVIMHSPYVVFEYCSGSDLFNFLVTGPFEKLQRVSGFSEPLARHYFTQALLAVIYLHERGVYHRDIKPENCVLDHNFNLKLTDFGTNKFLTPAEPGQLLRASTKGVGTDAYRAPEVNGMDYDPSAADVWSLGVTLLFIVGVEHMVEKVKEMDQFLRPVMAPLGIFFPFPYHCSLLDTYMQSDAAIAAKLRQSGGQTVSRCYPNLKFWSYWSSFRDSFSPELADLFNCIFVLSPSHRILLRDLVRHPWISSSSRLSPDEIVTFMRNRTPSSIVTAQNASPSIMANKLLGGVDQAALRQSLSAHRTTGNLQATTASPEYLSDPEVWTFSRKLRDMEGLQMDIVVSDIQNIMMDISLCQQIFQELLQDPSSERARSIPLSNLPSGWVTQMLGCVGFLPQGRLLYLMRDMFDPQLVNSALGVLQGVELAVSRSIVNILCADMDDEEEEVEGEGQGGRGDEEMAVDEQMFMTLNNNADSGASTMHSSQPHSLTSAYDLPSSQQSQQSQRSLFSGTESPMGSFQGQSSQESNWTSYTNGGDSLSAQSSQESLPEAMMEARGSQDYIDAHYLMQLCTNIDRKHQPQQFKAATDFCKMSGLLCSYGLYQVVCNEQLALYCRGKTASFSARVVCIDETKGNIGVSSWCFQGNEEWVSILAKLSTDMTPTESTPQS